jgi:hypothetical protein
MLFDNTIPYPALYVTIVVEKLKINFSFQEIFPFIHLTILQIIFKNFIII